jgi:F420-dependent oxidoreductase-like protein
MHIGINGSSLVALGRPVSELIDHAVAAEADGFASWWIAQLGVPDALTVLGAAGLATVAIELGTAVIPTWPRHPAMLAAQALTAAELASPPDEHGTSGPNRLALGIGLAHKVSVESSLGIPFERPAANMAEYLDVLLPLLADRRVDVDGTAWSAHVEGIGGAAGVPAPSVLLAAMGPRMLELAGGRADGTVLWLSGPRAVESTIRPALVAAAEAAGRPAPRIVASVPVCVTDDPDGVRDLVGAVLAGYNDLPSYRGVMDAEGAGGPADVSLIGDEAAVRAGLARFADAGATDFSALEIGRTEVELAATRALLKDLAAAS